MALQSVFKLEQYGQSDQQERYNPRRAHQKSRNGCLPCKQRRVKVMLVDVCQWR
jgi:hypothetical protein